jgi:hypothetical protein
MGAVRRVLGIMLGYRPLSQPINRPRPSSISGGEISAALQRSTAVLLTTPAPLAQIGHSRCAPRNAAINSSLVMLDPCRPDLASLAMACCRHKGSTFTG